MGKQEIMKRLCFLLIAFTGLGFGQHHNDLAWTPGVGGDPATGFHIWRSATSPVPTTGTPYATVTSPTTIYSDTAVAAGQTNFYTVTAFNSGGESTPTNTVSCVTPFQAPAAPPALSGVAK